MSTTLSEKAESRPVPKSAKFGFIVLGFVSLTVSSHLLFAQGQIAPVFGLVGLISNVLIYFTSFLLWRRDRPLAVYGFLLLIVWVLVGFLLPVY